MDAYLQVIIVGETEVAQAAAAQQALRQATQLVVGEV